MRKEIAAVILAAGKGTRMKSELPKVLLMLGGQSLLGYVMRLVEGLGIEKIIVVVGYKGETVTGFLKGGG